MATAGMTSPVRGTKTEGAQEGGTKGYPSEALARVETTLWASAWRGTMGRYVRMEVD